MRRLPRHEFAKLIRQSAGVSQRQVAERVGVSQCTVSQWEAGVQLPSTEHSVRWGKALAKIQGGAA